MVTVVVREQLTPVQLEQNTSLNKIMKKLAKQHQLLEEHTNHILKQKSDLEDLRIHAKFMISNKEKEAEGLQREVSRMQVMDRMR